MTKRKPYPSDVSDEEWGFVVPYLTLMNKEAPQRKHELREVFTHCAGWHGLELRGGCFEAMVSDLRSILRVAQGRQGQPSAVILDGRTYVKVPHVRKSPNLEGALSPKIL